MIFDQRTREIKLHGCMYIVCIVQMNKNEKKETLIDMPGQFKENLKKNFFKIKTIPDNTHKETIPEISLF